MGENAARERLHQTNRLKERGLIIPCRDLASEPSTDYMTNHQNCLELCAVYLLNCLQYVIQL